MMKLLKFLIIPVSALLLCVACQDDEGVRPDSNQANTNVLGLVVPHSDNGEVQKVLFLKDGRRVNPVSGFANFDETEYGSKLLISFQPLENSNGILNVSVTSFSFANDSTFIPSDTVFIPGDTSYLPIDSVLTPVDTITNPGDSTDDLDSLVAVFKGTFVMFSTDSTQGNDYTISDTLTLTLSHSHFSCTPPSNNFPLGGSGTLVQTNDKLKFEDTNMWPPGTDRNLILDGNYNYYIYDRQLCLYTFRDGVYIAYYLHR